MDRLRCMFSQYRAGMGGEGTGRPYVFALLPLTREFKAVYEECTKPVLGELGCDVEHAQELTTVSSIVDAIFAQIAKASFLVADTTGKNPNVLYEVGYAYGIGKNVILLLQDARDIPFDIRGVRHIGYQPDRLSALGMTLKRVGSRLLKELGEPGE